MKFSRHEEDVRKFLAGKVESLSRGKSGPRGKKRRDQPIKEPSESGDERRIREREEAVIKFLAEVALAEEFVAEYGLPSPAAAEQFTPQSGVGSNATHALENSRPKDTDDSGEEITSIYSPEDAPSAPYSSPRKRNWHKRDIPSWSDDDQAVYDAICMHLKIGAKELHGEKAERASSLYRAVLARWRSTYKEADLLVSGLSGENVKKMLQRLKRDGDRFQRWLNDPSTAEHIADAMELYFLYPDRVHVFEDGSYELTDADGDLSWNIDDVYRPITDDAEDDRIMNILKDKGILPPEEYDIAAMMKYMEQFKLQQQAERDQWEQEHKQEIDLIKSQLAEVIENARVRLEEELSKASGPPNLNAIFNLKPSNLFRQPSPAKRP